ncbi:MAG: DUF1080 domain-containing protein [Acidobacteriota bacterium]|nr:DUF1080 domain-containing protein [Acidobacteriota bacterium]
MWKLIFSGAALCANLTMAAENQLTPDEKRDGWVLLFDGKTMAGWRDPGELTPAGNAWTIEDGCLKATAKPLITEDLFTKRTFRDFELAFDWRIAPGGNSGVKYRIQKHLFIAAPLPDKKEKFEETVERSFRQPVTGRPENRQDYVVGFEYQITDDTANRDARSNPKHTAGALYDMVAPTTDATKPVGEFNQSRIVVRGMHVEQWLNGVKVVDSELNGEAALAGIKKRWAAAPEMVKLLSEQPVKDCPISLQNHGDEAWFRNIRVRELR